MCEKQELSKLEHREQRRDMVRDNMVGGGR